MLVSINGREINFSAAVELMDSEIRQSLHDLGVTDEQTFCDMYCGLHDAEYGEKFTCE